MQTTADYGCSMMRNFGILGAPLSKRDELPPTSLSMSPYHHSHYLSQRDSWGTGAKTYRNGQPVAQSLHPCSFTTNNVKEEEIACVYQPESERSKDSNDTSTYIRLGDSTRQTDQSTIAAHDYFRGGQVYSAQGGPQGGGFGTDFSTMPRITSPVEIPSSDESVKRNKSKEGTADEEMKAEENDTNQGQPRKEENGPKIDSCTDESDNELKGESLKPLIAQSFTITHCLSHSLSLCASHTHADAHNHTPQFRHSTNNLNQMVNRQTVINARAHMYINKNIFCWEHILNVDTCENYVPFYPHTFPPT